MKNLHWFGLVRSNKKTGKIDTTMTGLGSGLIKMWALQNTPKNKVSVIVDVEERYVVAEYVGTDTGFPKIHNHPDDFEFDVPEELFDIFEEEIAKRKSESVKPQSNTTES